MPERSRADELEQLVAATLARPDSEPPPADPSVAPLLRIARDLRQPPRKDLKLRLKSDLERKTTMATPVEALASVRQTATPRLRIKDAGAALEFYKKAFGAGEI